MLDRPYRFQVGPYWLLLPRTASVTADVSHPKPGSYRTAWTNWTVALGRFRLFLHLDPLHDLDGLKAFIDQQTRGNVTPTSVSVNGVLGVTHGDYGPARTWIDWWFKKSRHHAVRLPSIDGISLYGA